MLLLHSPKELIKIKLVFDNYISVSLKSKTTHAQKRTSGNEVKYKVSDKGCIGGSLLKELLSNTETKCNLIIYLTDISLMLYSKRIKYATTYEVITVTKSIKDFDLKL